MKASCRPADSLSSVGAAYLHAVFWRRNAAWLSLLEALFQVTWRALLTAGHRHHKPILASAAGILRLDARAGVTQHRHNWVKILSCACNQSSCFWLASHSANSASRCLASLQAQILIMGSTRLHSAYQSMAAASIALPEANLKAVRIGG